jgi:hypothetical protein
MQSVKKTLATGKDLGKMTPCQQRLAPQTGATKMATYTLEYDFADGLTCMVEAGVSHGECHDMYIVAIALDDGTWHNLPSRIAVWDDKLADEFEKHADTVNREWKAQERYEAERDYRESLYIP